MTRTIADLSPADEATLRAYIATKLDEVRYSDLSLHIVSAHCNGAGLNNTHADLLDDHHHEHHGPGGIRNHPYDDLFWDVEKIATVLIECAEMYGDSDTDVITAYKAAIDQLMERPDKVTAIAPGAHLHDPAPDPRKYTGEQCTTAQCDQYPRFYDLKVTLTPDSDVKDVTYTAVFTHEQDLDETNRLVKTALNKATDALKALDHNYQSSRILPEVTNTQARLANLPRHTA